MFAPLISREMKVKTTTRCFSQPLVRLKENTQGIAGVGEHAELGSLTRCQKNGEMLQKMVRRFPHDLTGEGGT